MSLKFKFAATSGIAAERHGSRIASQRFRLGGGVVGGGGGGAGWGGGEALRVVTTIYSTSTGNGSLSKNPEAAENPELLANRKSNKHQP